MSNEKQDSVCTVTSVPVNSLCTGFGYIVGKLKCCEKLARKPKAAQRSVSLRATATNQNVISHFI